MAIKVQLYFPRDLLEGLRDSLGRFAQQLREGQLAIDPQLPTDDEDLANAWEEELREQMKTDVEDFLRLLGHQRFGRGVIMLEDAEADALLRACSSLRLHLRNHPLSCISDSQLEDGSVAPADLPSQVREAYLAYLMLAGLQTLVIEVLDPESQEF